MQTQGRVATNWVVSKDLLVTCADSNYKCRSMRIRCTVVGRQVCGRAGDYTGNAVIRFARRTADVWS